MPEAILVGYGLPVYLASRALLVLDPYRKNPLSFIPGGGDVVVERYDGNVLWYTKVKYVLGYTLTVEENPDVESIWVRDECDESFRQVMIREAILEEREEFVEVGLSGVGCVQKTYVVGTYYQY